MDETSTGAPLAPDPPEETGGQAGGSKRGVKAVALEAVQAYRNINKVERWGGGGFTLSTLVKLAGWAGLIAILAVLVMKLREVEEQLDPVTNIVTKLMKEVEASRVSVKKHTQETQVELEALKHEATELKTSVAKTGEAQLAAQHALEEVDRHARALSERLELESSRTAALGAQGDTASETLKDYAHSLGDLQAQLKSTSDQATANVKALSESVKKANEQVSDLQKTLAGMQASPAPASLAKLDSAAKDLTQSLDRASARMKTAEGSLPPVEKKAGRAPETLTSHLATTSTTATPSKPPP